MVLRPKHLRAIALLVGTDLEKQHVAAEVGIAPQTLTRWLKDSAFREELARRREVQPYRMDGLRMQAARHALMDVVARFRSDEDKPSMREVTHLLDRLVGDDLRRAHLDEERHAGEPPAPPEEQVEPRELTPEEAEAIWRAREAQYQLEEKAREEAESPIAG